MRKITSYREETEELILGLTLLLMGLILLVAAALSICIVPFLAIGMVVMMYLRTKSMHAGLLRRAKPITPPYQPAAVSHCARLQNPAAAWCDRRLCGAGKSNERLRFWAGRTAGDCDL